MKKNAKQLLNFQADRIEATLHQHRVMARVGSVTVGPRWVRFMLHVAVGTTVSSVKARAEELRLSLGSTTVRVIQTDAGLAVDMPRDQPHRVELDSLDTGEPRPFGTAVVGMTPEGAPLMIRFWVSSVAHILVAGTTGAGKSVLLRSMCLDLAANNTPDQ